MYLKELTLGFSSREISKAFNALAKDCPHLTKLNIDFSGIANGTAKDRCLKGVIGMKALLSPQGIKVLKLIGNDHTAASQPVDLVDVDSIGPLLRHELMKPRVSDLEALPRPKRACKVTAIPTTSRL